MLTSQKVRLTAPPCRERRHAFETAPGEGQRCAFCGVTRVKRRVFTRRGVGCGVRWVYSKRTGDGKA